jgi:hypothetical protein
MLVRGRQDAITRVMPSPLDISLKYWVQTIRRPTHFYLRTETETVSEILIVCIS